MADCLWTLDDVLDILEEPDRGETLLNLVSFAEGSDSLRNALHAASSGEIRILADSLLGVLPKMCCCKQGHKVVLDLYTRSDETCRRGLISEVLAEAERLTESPFGCIVLCRFLDNTDLSGVNVYELLIDRLLAHHRRLRGSRTGKEVLRQARLQRKGCDMRPLAMR